MRRLFPALVLIALGAVGCVTVPATGGEPVRRPPVNARPMTTDPEPTPGPAREALAVTGDDKPSKPKKPSSPSSDPSPRRPAPARAERPPAYRAPAAEPRRTPRRAAPPAENRRSSAARRPHTDPAPVRTARPRSRQSYDMSTVCDMARGTVDRSWVQLCEGTYGR